MVAASFTIRNNGRAEPSMFDLSGRRSPRIQLTSSNPTRRMGARPGKSTGSRIRPGMSPSNTPNATKFLREPHDYEKVVIAAFAAVGASPGAVQKRGYRDVTRLLRGGTKAIYAARWDS